MILKRQWEFLEFLWICADFSFLEFVRMYANPLHTQGGVSAYVSKWKTSGVSADMRIFLLCRVCVDIRKTTPHSGRSFCLCMRMKTSAVSADMRRLLLCGVPATVRKKAPCHYYICISTQMNNWGFCGYGQLLEREKATSAHTICRSSNTGVSETIR